MLLFRCVIIMHAINNRLGLLCGRPVIEIDQGLAIDLLFKDREITTYF